VTAAESVSTILGNNVIATVMACTTDPEAGIPWFGGSLSQNPGVLQRLP
jgi:hypothetical protein